MLVRGRYVSFGAAVRVWAPWAALMTAGTLYGGWEFVVGWAGLCALFVAWVLLYSFLIFSPDALLARTPNPRGAAAAAGAELPPVESSSPGAVAARLAAASERALHSQFLGHAV